MIDGQGAADRAALDHAVKWLFAAIYPIKRIARERMGKNFVEPPLEGLWWEIVDEPDWLTSEMFDTALATATTRLGEPPATLRLEHYPEGPASRSCMSAHPAPRRRALPGCTASFCRRTT
jgi:hypothetical protein